MAQRSRASLALAKSTVKAASAEHARPWIPLRGCYPANVARRGNPRSNRRDFRRRAARIAASLTVAAGLAAAFASLRSAALAPADFTFANDVEPSSLDPASATGIAEGRVARFLFEGLCIHDPKTLAILPGMAESWTISRDGRAYVFTLRADARWSDGERLTARDFTWSFERLLDPRTGAEYAYELWPVHGAKRFTTDVDEHGAPRSSFDTVAIRATDERTLAITLDEPLPYFLDVLTMPALAPVSRKNIDEARARFPDTWSSEWMKPGALVSNGPYTLALRRVNDRIRFAKNPFYWDAAHVAFDTVDALAVEHVGTMLNLYLTGAIGWADNAPASAMPRLLPREDFERAPYLATSFYRVNVTRPPLDDKRVRRALALAIDRAAITAKITRAGELAAWSFVPPCANAASGIELSHDVARASDELRFARDVDEARHLLAEAGFGPDGRPMPPIEIHYNTQANNKDVAEVIADAWRKNLGIDVKFANQEWKVYLDAQKRLEYEVSRSSWIGDHPDAIGFLEIFESGGENNRTGWKNARYDELVERARTSRGDERTASLRDAEAILLDELPILPLYFFVTKNLVDPRLGGFYPNALDEHSPKFWYWMDDDELASKRAAELRASSSDSRTESAIEREAANSPSSPGASASSLSRAPPSMSSVVRANASVSPVLRANASVSCASPARAIVESHGPHEGLYPPADPKFRARASP
jgi:oligopeptide transport system substrate-binding protein